MQISARCVLPVTSTSRLRNSRSTSQGAIAPPGSGICSQRDLQLVELIVARLVDSRRLARRPDEQSAEQVGERWMVLPIGDDAPQQIGAPQEGAVGRRDAAEHDVIAAAGADVPAVQHELLCAEADVASLVVDGRGDLHRLLPRGGRMDVDLDDAGIGRDLDDIEARVVRRRVPFQAQRHAHRGRGCLDGGNQGGIVPGICKRRQEHAQMPAARLDRQRRPHQLRCRLRDRRGRPHASLQAQARTEARAARRTDRPAGRWDSRGT